MRMHAGSFYYTVICMSCLPFPLPCSCACCCARAYVDEVRREPVELGFPEWNGAAMGSPLQRTGLEAGQQQAYHPPEPLAVADPVAAAAAAQDKLAQARLVGLGSRESVLPVQVGSPCVSSACVCLPGI